MASSNRLEESKKDSVEQSPAEVKAKVRFDNSVEQSKVNLLGEPIEIDNPSETEESSE